MSRSIRYLPSSRYSHQNDDCTEILSHLFDDQSQVRPFPQQQGATTKYNMVVRPRSKAHFVLLVADQQPAINYHNRSLPFAKITLDLSARARPAASGQGFVSVPFQRPRFMGFRFQAASAFPYTTPRLSFCLEAPRRCWSMSFL